MCIRDSRSMVNYTLNKNISFQPGIDINTESGEGERLKAGTSSLNDYAAFITAEITPVEKLNIRPGLRFVKNSVYNAPPIVPSLNAKYSLSKHLDWRMAVSYTHLDVYKRQAVYRSMGAVLYKSFPLRLNCG